MQNDKEEHLVLFKNKCLDSVYLILNIHEWTHIKFLRKSHAVIEFNAMHSGVIKIKSFQLECQQVRKVQESQTLRVGGINEETVPSLNT